MNRTAIHEAGHAVAAFRRDVTVKSVSILRDGDTRGHVRVAEMSDSQFDRLTEARQRRYLDRRAFISIAGPVAEIQAFGADRSEAGSQDRERALALADVMYDNDVEVMAYIERQYRQVKRFTVEWWPVIAGVAGELERRGRLNGAEFLEVVRGVVESE